MYPMTRESVMAAISSSVAEKAVCWCDGRKKRSRRILRRLTHLAVGGRVIGGGGNRGGKICVRGNGEGWWWGGLRFFLLLQGVPPVCVEKRPLCFVYFFHGAH